MTRPWRANINAGPRGSCGTAAAGDWALSALLWRGMSARDAGTERDWPAAARLAGCHLHSAPGEVVELVGGEIAAAPGDVDLILELVTFFFLSCVTAGAVVLLVRCRHEFMSACFSSGFQLLFTSSVTALTVIFLVQLSIITVDEGFYLQAVMGR